jgi:antitoxin (DNA-binding transcriptional repressor) of toxin-antitoxin stability system
MNYMKAWQGESEVMLALLSTRLSELLHTVRGKGERYTITIRGESVADLVPSEATKQRDVPRGSRRHAGVQESARSGWTES